MIYAVIDTNVLVSALLAEHNNIVSPPREISRHAIAGNITPIIHDEIVAEYFDVLLRDKFPFSVQRVEKVIAQYCTYGIKQEAMHFDGALPDEKDRIFLEVALAARRKYSIAYLVTGNKKHFPDESFILSPAELLAVVGE